MTWLTACKNKIFWIANVKVGYKSPWSDDVIMHLSLTIHAFCILQSARHIVSVFYCQVATEIDNRERGLAATIRGHYRRDAQAHTRRAACVTALSFCCVLSDSGGKVAIERLAPRCYHGTPLFGLSLIGHTDLPLECVGRSFCCVGSLESVPPPKKPTTPVRTWHPRRRRRTI